VPAVQGSELNATHFELAPVDEEEAAEREMRCRRTTSAAAHWEKTSSTNTVFDSTDR
jgi:hypothetical protein